VGEPDEVARVELELERGVEPISGRVRIEGVPDRTFAGMLELMGLLDDVRGTSRGEPVQTGEGGRA
jgi:hypothetical protein